ncbi:hypothetical protein [Mucilaginibacter sp. 10I4]|uniref:hypothetical protein n=1 Tax=Mucilaginibacter sp. 10I4 TaxID=3048580 RepID=UPI002B2372A0|nr:hypothetical protein [Mucilaginibacter sp. 10I4]MEB0260750.1 hypothetical protein [Mucilaginibacter sp. 10I4]
MSFDKDFADWSSGKIKLTDYLNKQSGSEYSNTRKSDLPPHPLRRPQTSKPNYVQQKPTASFKMPKFNMPNINIGAVINLAILGAVGIAGFKLYNMFFGGASNIISNTQDRGEKALAGTFVSTEQSKADSLKNTASSLSTKGLSISNQHMQLALNWHDMFDRMFPNHSSIIANLKKSNIQTLRLVASVYGTRPIDGFTYWSIQDGLFTDNKKGYTFKDAIKMILSDSELKEKSIASIINVLP